MLSFLGKLGKGVEAKSTVIILCHLKTECKKMPKWQLTYPINKGSFYIYSGGKKENHIFVSEINDIQ